MPDDATAVLHDYIERFSNWGRWGPDDEIGTLNYVGREDVLSAVRLVEAGRVISLTLPYDSNGCQNGTLRGNPQLVVTASGTDVVAGVQSLGPFGPAKGFGYSDDMIIMGTQVGTQWDSLSHIFYEGKMYNGRGAEESGASGARYNSIEKGLSRFVMRGVLLDVAGWVGVDSLEPGRAITVEELDAVAAAQGVEVRRGDAVLVRTGFLGARRRAWGDYAGGDAPGLSLHTIPWVHEREIAAIASDTWGVEVRPYEIDHMSPWHCVALTHIGLTIGEIFDMDALARDCASDGRYEFLFVAPPLPITGASGSPLTGLAIK